MKQLRFLATIGLLTTGLLPLPAQAAGEQIQNFSSTVHITKQNRVEISESIDYDFGSTPHHGIFRDIPVDYQDSDGKQYHLAFENGKVSDQSGASIQTSYSKSNGQEELKIGDPNNTITGLHTYKISYVLTPLVNQKNGRDHLALDITGNSWPVPILHASTVVTVDDGATFSDIACFAGPAGSSSQEGCSIIPKPPAASQPVGPPLTFTSGAQLEPGSGMTIEAYLPNGYVDHYLVAGKAAPLTSSDYAGIAAFMALVAAFVLGAFVIGLRWWREHQRKQRQTIIAQYEPPDGLRPGEVGLLIDDKSDMKEITAILIDLAVRGYIKIEQTAPKSLFSKAQYQLTKLKDWTDVNPYEAELLGAVFGSQTSIALSQINKTAMSLTVSSVTSHLKEALKQRGYYGAFSQEKGVLQKALDTGNLTDEGAAEWAKVAGFKLYLGVAEKDRLNFTDAPERTPERFNALLPYAIALGVEKQWAKQFEGIDVSQNAGWYGGYNAGAWTAFALADDLSGGFAGAVSSNFVAPSGGGGSSGGGFGGGGGGSW